MIAPPPGTSMVMDRWMRAESTSGPLLPVYRWHVDNRRTDFNDTRPWTTIRLWLGPTGGLKSTADVTPKFNARRGLRNLLVKPHPLGQMPIISVPITLLDSALLPTVCPQVAAAACRCFEILHGVSPPMLWIDQIMTLAAGEAVAHAS